MTRGASTDDGATLRSMTTALLKRVVQVNVTPGPIDPGEPTGMALVQPFDIGALLEAVRSCLHRS